MEYALSHFYPTPIETLERARDIGYKVGLRYVYIGNVPGHPGENTYCPGFGGLIIEREGFYIADYRLKDNACPLCSEPIAGRFPERFGESYKVWKGYEVGIV